MNAKNLLLDVLTIIDYQDNKMAYTNKIIALSNQKALKKLLNTLPPQQQEQFEKEFNTVYSGDKSVEKANIFFTNKQMQESIDETFLEVLQDLLQAIIPSLTLNKKRELELLLNLGKLEETEKQYKK